MSNAEHQACEVPLVEQLRSVPKTFGAWRATQWSDDGRETGHQHIPVGYLFHRAADEIESLLAFKRSVDEALNSGDGSYRP